MLAVLIVDDHLVAREGLKHILNEEVRGIVFGEAATAAGALLEAAGKPWDIVVLGISIHGSSGFQILEQILALRPTARVLILTTHGDPQYAVRAFSLGALAYVTKDAARADLLAAFNSVLRGRKYLSPSVSGMPDGGLPVEDDVGPAILSSRERTVLLALAAGKRINEIATELQLHEKTVSTYRRRLLDKLHLKSTADLVHYVIDHEIS